MKRLAESAKMFLLRIVNFFRHIEPEVNSVEVEDIEFDPTQGQAHNATERDNQYTLVICDYVRHQRKVNAAQRWFKTIFFIMVCAAFVAIVSVCLFAILTIVSKDNIEWDDFAVALASVVSLINVVNVLPGKIAEHLFPTGGDKDITDFIISMNQSDKQKIGGTDNIRDIEENNG